MAAVWAGRRFAPGSPARRSHHDEDHRRNRRARTLAGRRRAGGGAVPSAVGYAGGLMTGAAPATACGAALILLVTLDVFDALFHHRGAGLLSGAVMRATWRVVRRMATGRRALLPAAGPLALVVVITCWLALLVVGWAIVLWPHLPSGFRFAPGAAAGEGAFVDALYISLVTLATLGFGDVTPATGWLKLVLPLEALVGLGLLTATVSWLLSIHPALSRRRSLAYEITLLRDAERDAASSVFDGGYGEATLAGLTSRLVEVERDFTALP